MLNIIAYLHRNVHKLLKNFKLRKHQLLSSHKLIRKYYKEYKVMILDLFLIHLRNYHQNTKYSLRKI